MKNTEILRLNNVSGGYQGENIIRDISLEINTGDFLGIIGPNGSGKTTLLRLMSNVLFPKTGEISFFQKELSSIKQKDFCKKAAFVQQETVFNFSFSVFEFVLLGRVPHLGRMQFEGKRDFSVAMQALEMTGASDLKEKKIDCLSCGERQRVAIAKALAQEPVLLFLDEPTSHLDIGHQVQVLNLIKKLNREKDLTVIMVIHDLNLAAEFCDRLVLLDKGSIYKQGGPEEVLTYQNIESVYKTIVVADKNPISGKPYILAVTRERQV